MKIIIGIFLILSLSITTLFSAEVSTSFWKTEKSQHFIIYYQEASKDFVEELTDKAENYYNSIIEDLGFRRFDFWSWENRAKIFLYNNSADYLKDTNSLAWSGAQVWVQNRTIKTFIGQQSFFDSILPHEMTHMIFREFVGLKIGLPLWIDEGVSCSQEKSYLAMRMKTAKSSIENNTSLKFDKLFQIYAAGLIPAVNDFYAQSASIITFLLNKYDRQQFLDFSRKIRDGIHWQKALLDAYRFANVEELESAWKNYMLNN